MTVCNQLLKTAQQQHSFNGMFPGTARVNRQQNVKSFWILLQHDDKRNS